MFGILNVYKPAGITSHDVVARLRKVVNIKQIGHTGTLDPFAEGVLSVCIGKATRLIQYLDDDKAYVGTFKFGASTSTYDREGETVRTSGIKITEDDINSLLADFEGEIEQYPPIYSAIKVKGKKLYEYAREGLEAEIKPRKVNIRKIELKNFSYENQEAEIFIDCSKGTYIRSIAEDIGKKTGAYAYLDKLIRVKAGSFLVKDSVRLDELRSCDDVERNLIYPLEVLNYPVYELTRSEYEKISHGNIVLTDKKAPVVMMIYDNRLAAIVENKEIEGYTMKVFV